MTDMARLAGVSRPAVTNWRKRHDDFPAPVEENDTVALFRAADVFAWMDKHGKKRAKRSPEQGVWTAVSAGRGFLQVEEAALIGMEVLGSTSIAYDPQPAAEFLRRITAGSSDDVYDVLKDLTSRISREVSSDRLRVSGLIDAPEWAKLAPLVQNVASVALEFGIPETFEALLSSMARGPRSGSEHSSPDGIAQLLTRLLPVHGTVADFACGQGTFLLAAARAAKSDHLQLIAQDLQVSASTLTRLRMAAHGIAAQVSYGDSLTAATLPDLRADLVLLDPPFASRWRPENDTDPARWRFVQPPKNAGDVAWIQHAISRLNPGGRAAIVTSNGPLFRSGVDAELRRRLLEAGCIEAVIALPGGLYALTSIPVAIWILRRPDEASSSDVLLVDASKIAEGSRGRTLLEDQHIERIELAIARLRSGDRTVDEFGVAAARVPISRLLTEGSTLVPARWMERHNDPAAIVDRIRGGQRRLEDLKASLLTTPTRRAFAVEVAQPMGQQTKRTVKITDVADLVRSPVIKSDVAGTGTTPLIRPGDIATDLSVSPSDSVDLDLLPDVMLTQPGDVVVATEGRIRAGVDTAGGAVGRGPMVQILRPRPGTMAPLTLAALISHFGQQQGMGTTIKRVDIGNLQIPAIDSGAADDLQETLNGLFQQRRILTTAIETIGDLAEAFVIGLGDELVQFDVAADHQEQP
ncbi:N-6 DNA methylase [Catenulispora pinisilvae]|uniref:N-6 DNA methylase n=1 Tax=Catenulispora pinisilvae TaxID=2705253 RepID=UPI0018923FCF|nr:N-6 DNA methylase [Catenulispora pinisilvae]